MTGEVQRPDVPRGVRLGGALISLVGVGMVGYAIAFIVRNFTHLIEIGLGPERVNVTQEEVLAFSEGLHNYISHVQVNLGGFIAAMGIALIFLGWWGVARGATWSWWAVLVTSLTWVLVGGPIHVVYGLDPPGHLGPGYVAVAVLAAALVLSRPRRSRS